jgi:hypothetical protein
MSTPLTITLTRPASPQARQTCSQGGRTIIARQPGLSALLVVVAGLIAVDDAHAQFFVSYVGDPRVRPLLDEIGWRYEVDSDGDYKLTFNYSDGRRHLVYLSSATYKLGSLDVRKVWAPAVFLGSHVNEHIAYELLRANSSVKIGAWRLAQNRQGFFAVFAAQISAETDAQSLATVVRAVGATADEAEKRLTGRDDW